jgi:short-subunit dehydrogenase
MSDPRLHGKTALITGASSGLGADFARQLAERGCHLILVARRTDKLEEVKQEITTRLPVEVTLIPLDLTSDDAPQRLYDTLQSQGQTVDVLVNNAGYGMHGGFLEIPWPRERNMLELNMLTVVHMTKLFAKEMVARNFGYIVLIASVGAYQPSPNYATYAATKAFVLNFGEAINYELRHTQVRCTVLSPGYTATEFHDVVGHPISRYARMTMMDSPATVRTGIEAMLAEKPSVVAGWFNALMAWTVRLLPRRLVPAISYRLATIR